MAAETSKTIIELKERDTRQFPREELFYPSGQSRILPETRALSAIDLRETATGLELRALGLIGYLPLTPSIVLNLKPKFPVQNLWRMLALADETYELILPVLRHYERAEGTAPHQLLARGFCHYLREIVAKGVARGYFREPHRGHYKPKVNFGQTLARYMARGDDLNVSADVFAFSADLPINRILKAACVAFFAIIPKTEAWDEERRLLSEALHALRLLRPQSLRSGGEAISETAPSWLRPSYRGVMAVYSVLLGYTNVGFAYDAQGSEMPSFLFSLDTVFESFVRNTFRTELKADKLSVVDGNKPEHQHALFLDNKRFPTKPDIIIRKKRDVRCLGEVKYKPKIEESDRYQLLSHVVATSAPLGFWVSPALAAADAGLEYIGKIASGAKFYHYRLDISGDLEAARIEMVQRLKPLFA